ncbi:MAG: carboxypeptidase regulatory-like domain-containing protein [Acidobacteriaceae bacterium]|nr:carboxypeptidase regulatory-like domain-containing protein [Acidobacteriaceae bacterium]
MLSRLVIFLVGLLCLAGSHVFAQTSFGRISGTITDPSGAPIADVQVVITNVNTQAARTVNTDTNGFYSATELPIGDYSVQANAGGFQSEQRTGLHVTADARLTADFKLQIGSVSQQVEVTAVAGETINTTSGELARNIDTKQVNNLPSNGRNYVQLMTLVPGAVVTSTDTFAVTTSLSATGQTINGNRPDTNNLTVDGAFNLVAGSNGSLMNNVSSEFVNEIKLETSNMSAEWGRMSGPAFNVVTRNGTNEFHGAAFEYFRNDLLDARNFFAAQKTQLRFNDFGYDLGGPIIKNKFFFFVGEEWKRLRQQQNPTRLTVPDTAELNGNFAGSGITVYQPGTGNTTKIPVPGNNISSSITPDGRAISNVYRLMEQRAASFSDTPTSNNITLAPSNPLNFREDIVRLDYTISEKNSLYGRWVHDDNQLIDPFGTFAASGNLPTTPTLRMRPGQSFLIAETWIPTAHIVNEARANASWASQHIPPYGNTWERATYGFQFQQLFSGGQYDNGIPQVSITNYAGFQGPNFALLSPTTDIQFSNTLSWTIGNHVLRMGAVYIRDRVDQNGRPPYPGNITFNASGTPTSTGNALADALLGNFKSYQEASTDPVGFFRFTQPEAFVQDSWKVSPKLSLEIGIRYQYLEPMYTVANNMVNFDPARYNPAQAVRVTLNGTVVAGSGNPYNGLIRAGNGIPQSQLGRVPGSTGPLFQQIPAGAPRGLYDSKSLFGPRFGFAYAFDDKTVLRGGFGVFYDRPEGNVTFSQVNLPPILQISEYNNGNLSNITGGAPGAAPLGGISAIDPHLKYTTTYQYSFGIQRQLPLSMMLETSYVGNLGRHLLRQPNINYPNLSLVAANPNASNNAFVPYLGYSSIQQYLSDSTSNYNALQVYVSKRAGAVTATAGYTWSKALGDASGEGDNVENWQDRHYNYGPLSFDRRHVFTGSFVWQMPMLRNLNGYLRSAIGGWQLSGVIRLQSGAYNTIMASTATGTRRAEYLGGPVTVSNPTPALWFNKAAFAAAPTGTFSNMGVGVVEGPGLQSYDLSLAKHFALTERFDLKFQGDFFNAFNITNFNVASANTTVTSGGYGTFSQASPPRQVQLSLKLAF